MFKIVKTWVKFAIIISLILGMTLGDASNALASPLVAPLVARTGGRIGGGSFRVPSRTVAPPTRTYPGGGGGFGFPFLLPFFGFGSFGSLFTILVFITIVNFLVRSWQSVTDGTRESTSTKTSVAQVQVGLLANARDLQQQLNQLANTADTGSAAGITQLLQEASLALLRHPEYWVYGFSESTETSKSAAEGKFNQLALNERSKFSVETISNVNNQIRESQENSTALVEQSESGEYIIATIIVGVNGKLKLPTINSAQDLRISLEQIGSIGSDRLLAVEVLWTPQAEGDTLTTDDILAYYPNLKLV